MNPCFFYVRKPEKRQKRTKRHKLGTKCNSFQPVFHILCTKKKKYLWTITFSLSHWDLFSALLAIVALVFLHCRKIVEKCNYYMAKGIREQDCLAKQLERTRIEKEMMEKVIKAELAEAVKSFMTGEKNDGCTTDCKRQISRIEITYFI